MIDVVYTGDVRGTQEIARQNHQLFFKEFDKVCENLIEAKTVKEQMKLAV